MQHKASISTGLILFLITQVSPVVSQTRYDIADALNLLPTPREITLSGSSRMIQDWTIVVPSENSILAAGAAEINDRVAALGGTALAVRQTLPKAGPAILVGRWLDPGIRETALALGATLSADDPGEQGYIIRFGECAGRPVILLGGSDAQGALYACVTFRRLLQRRGNEIVALEAAVRDRPDFKIRNNGTLDLGRLRRTGATPANPGPMYTAATELKHQVDWFLRHKVNYVSTGFVLLQDDNDPDLFTLQRRLALEVLQYAKSRGIKTRFGGGAEISNFLSPEQARIAVQRQRGSRYLFSALDAHRAHARQYASFLGPASAGLFSFHPNDSGGYLDPGMWHRYRPETRAMFNDFLGRASLEQFLIYFDAARAAVPGIELEAVVYPYHYQYARPDFPEMYTDLIPGTALSGMLRRIRDRDQARRVRERLLAYHRYLARNLPRDVSIVFREAGREEFTACADVFSGHPLTIWTYPDCNKGWLGTFVPQVRMTKTFWFPERRDVFYVASSWTRWGDWRVQRLAQQEYLWNTDHPDASIDFSQRARTYEGSGGVTDFQRDYLIPRISRILYGAAAPAFAQLAAADVSLAYAADPVSTALGEQDGEDFDDPGKYLTDQAREFRRLQEEFSQLSTGDLVGDPETAVWASYYQRYLGMAAIKAELEAAADRCRKALHAGDDTEAQHVVQQTVNRLPALQREWASLPPLQAGARRQKALEDFSPDAFRDVLQQLMQESPANTERCRLTSGERVNQTSTYGYSTIIRCDLYLQLPSDFRDHTVLVTITDRDGSEVGSTWFPAAWIVDRHISPTPLQIDLGDVVEGDLHFAVSAGPRGSETELLGRYRMDDAGAIRSE